jgi:DNA repair protein RadC
MSTWEMNSSHDYPKLKIEKKTKITHTKHAVKLVRSIADRQQEFVIVISLMMDYTVTNARMIAIGGRTSATFCPASLFRGVLLDDASEMIVVHNHPSGDLMPTKADKKVMKNIVKTGKLLDINVVDCIIISGKKYRSFMR